MANLKKTDTILSNDPQMKIQVHKKFLVSVFFKITTTMKQLNK